MNYLPSWQLFQKKKKKFLKWDCSADFIADFNTDSDITLLKCKICRKYTAQIRTEAHSRYLRGQILDSILPYVDNVTYVQKTNMYNHAKAGGLHVWAKIKFVMDS